jgi:hypothetical protein
MKKFKQHFSSMDNRFLDEEIEKAMNEKNGDTIKNSLKELSIKLTEKDCSISCFRSFFFPPLTAVYFKKKKAFNINERNLMFRFLCIYGNICNELFLFTFYLKLIFHKTQWYPHSSSIL